MNREETTKNLLMISYFYPPLAGAGTLRPLYYSRYLPRNGWKADVLTVSSDPFYPHDSSLAKDIPKGQRIFRAQRLPIYEVIRYFSRKRLRNYPLLFSFLDSYFDWVPIATRIGIEVAKKSDYDAIYATAPPYSSLRVAAGIKKKTGLPVLADLRDPLSDNDFIKWPTPLHRMFYDVYECSLLRRMDRIVTVNELMQRQVMRRTAYSEDKVVVIPNGYDSDLFSRIHSTPPTDTLRLGYVGSIYGAVDPSPVFRAVEYALMKHPEMQDQVTIEFMGRMDENLVAQKAERAGIRSLVRMHGPRSHEDAVAFMKSCHVLLLFGGMVLPNAVSAKLFEYAAAGPPVLSFSKPGLQESFLLENELGYSVDGSDPHLGGEQLIRFFREFKETDHVSRRTTNSFSAFSKENLSSRLAKVLNSMVV